MKNRPQRDTKQNQHKSKRNSHKNTETEHEDVVEHKTKATTYKSTETDWDSLRKVYNHKYFWWSVSMFLKHPTAHHHNHYTQSIWKKALHVVHSLFVSIASDVQ